MKNHIISLFVLLCLLCNEDIVSGQKLTRLFADDHDSNYIESHKSQLTTRLYASRKYTDLKIRDTDKDVTLNYRPNDRINLGFGATYNAFTLNIGINFPFVNHDDDKYGKTDYLDLQSHLLFRKLAAEVYFSSFKGYYNANPDENLSNYKDAGSDTYPQRRDIFTIDLGATVYYIFNHKRFSYRAAFNQDERQKKSAGSFLAGPAVFTTYFQGDSALIPFNINPSDFSDGVQIKRSRYAKISVCAGYAYNLVIWERIFLMASLIGGPGAGYTKIFTETDDIEGIKKWDLSFIYTFRAGAGYNGKNLFVGISYVNTSVSSPTPVENTRYFFKRGNIRFNIAYRIPFRIKSDLN